MLVSSVLAQETATLLPLPTLAECRSSHPRFPERWRAAYLMAPFTRGQLVLGDIVHDAALPATRVRLLGADRGSTDLLITTKKTYLLRQRGSAIAECRDLGYTGWRPLPQDWLTPESQCVGSAPINEIAVDWWKTAIAPAPASDWIWFKRSNQSPFRLVFPFPTDRLSPFSQYALNYQVSFEPLSETDLPGIAAACRGAKPAAAQGKRALRQLASAMASSRERADSEIKRLIPALSASCNSESFPQWPQHLAITGLMTPYDSDENPYQAEVLYDWTVKGQRSRIFGQSGDHIAAQDFLLHGPQGYTITYHRPEGMTCEAVLPGVIRPDWAARAPCECAAEIAGGTPLTPYGPTRIMACPLASPRVAWAWYAHSGRPTVFMVTSRRGDEGKGLLAVLDYRDWLPGHRVAASVFDKPTQCAAAHQDGHSRALKRCSTCHLGNSARPK